MTTTILAITTQTTLPLASVTPLLANAVMQSGAIDAADTDGNVRLTGQAIITLPASAIAQFVEVPEGYAPENFTGGHFNLAPDGIIVTANWKK